MANAETLDTDHFRIRYVNKDEVVAVLAAPVLEAAYRNIGADLDLLAAERGERIVVEIYPDARGLSGATGLAVEAIETSGTIAVCKFHRLMITSPLATVSGYEWADTLSHELVHLIISKKSKNTVPIFLHEGIAKYFESRWKGAAGQALEPFGEKLLADAVRKNTYITYAQMHPSMALLPSQEAAALAFAEVFTTIEMLVAKHGVASIPKLLGRLSTGANLDRALTEVFGQNLAVLEQTWRKHLKTRRFREAPGASPRPIRLASGPEDTKKERPLENIEDREVHDFSRLGELLQLRGHHHAAIVEYEKARQKSAMRYATVIYRLARAYVHVDRRDDALALLAELLRAHPGEADAHLLAGRVLLERNDLVQARQHYEAVRYVNPFNPEVHAALGKIYAAQGETTAAEQATRFLALTSKPRPSRTLELPARPAGNATVSIITRDWSPVRINGGAPVATPLFDLPVNAGEVAVESLAPSRVGKLTTFSVAPNAAVLRLVD
jgi:tetratricopeptide (TPR) repeat protein